MFNHGSQRRQDVWLDQTEGDFGGDILEGDGFGVGLDKKAAGSVHAFFRTAGDYESVVGLDRRCRSACSADREFFL